MKMKNLLILFFVFLCAGLCTVRCAWAQNKVVRIEFSPQVEDYSDTMINALDELYQNGGGTLEIAYGIYPLKKTVYFDRRDKEVALTIRGQKNAAGERPVFYCDAEPGKTHRMFTFITGWTELYTMTFQSIEIQGNNVPVDRSTANLTGHIGNLQEGQSYGHPFLYHAGQDGDAIRASNLRSVHVDDVVIREIYGNGIFIANTGSKPNEFSESPSVTNTRIINTWQWQDGFMTGDGILFWAAKNPLVENCVIYNDISYTRWIGRIGVVLEHNTENAVIKNNIIGGYNSNIHIEVTYGGHQVLDNKLLAAVTGVTLNEPEPDKAAPDYAEYMAKVKPNIIKGNYMEYNLERIRYNVEGYGGRRAFIDTSGNSGPKLRGLQIVDNEMVFNDGQPPRPKTERYIPEIEIEGLVEENNFYH